MENNNKSKELQDIEFALQQYSQKHGGDVIITVSVCAFDDNNDIIDDYMWFEGDTDCMKISVEGMLEEIDNRKIIIIEHYPANMTFEVREKLPEFTFNCPVRNKILHKQLKEQNIDSPCHGYTEYGVDCIETFEGGEIWGIGS